MNITTTDILNDWLDKVAETLDITQRQYEDAENRYLAVGEFLNNCPTLSRYSPNVYPQGSFRLGTVVRPIVDGEEYDVDLICELQSDSSRITQEKLKNLIGNRLKEPKYQNLLQKEKRRCWVLKYHTESRFHLDVIPAIPDRLTTRFLNESYGMQGEITETAINITDNKDTNYSKYSNDWPKGNPKGYALWFEETMEQVLIEAKRTFASVNESTIEEVPFYAVKTPLQRAIQILKRHRDKIFGDDEDKPISIIITTLSGLAYNGEQSLLDALESIVYKMRDYIKEDKYGNDLITNPVDPRENFADKWVEYPERRENFYDWLDRVKLDLEMLKSKSTINQIEKYLQKILGDNVVAKSKNLIPIIESFGSGGLVLPNYSIGRHAPSEQFIQNLFPVYLENNYRFKINCEVTQDGYRPRMLRKMPVLRKKKSLRFFVEPHNIPKPYEIRWKIRNQGPESKNKERGEILSDNGREQRTESSSFRGDHYVECYVIKDGACIARDRIDVPISTL